MTSFGRASVYAAVFLLFGAVFSHANLVDTG